MAPPVLSYCAQEVRRFDNDRFVTALFAPAAAREALFALYAFNTEVARIRERVKEPLLGEMRLTWWQQTIERVFSEEAPPPAQPVAVALASAVHRHRLSRSLFERLLEGRRVDMRDTGPADLAELIDYAAATAGSLSALALEVLGAAASGPAAEAAEGVAIAWALTGLLRAVPFHARARRAYLPADLSRQAGLDVWALFAHGGRTEGLAQVVEWIATEADTRLRSARALWRDVPHAAVPALLAATLADAYLVRLARCRYNPFAAAVQQRPNSALIRMALNAARGRY